MVHRNLNILYKDLEGKNRQAVAQHFSSDIGKSIILKQAFIYSDNQGKKYAVFITEGNTAYFGTSKGAFLDVETLKGSLARGQRIKAKIHKARDKTVYLGTPYLL